MIGPFERLEQEYQEKAAKLEQCVSLLQRHIRCLRGEEQDLTGVGYWLMFCKSLEQVSGARIINEWDWQRFVELQKKANKEQS